MRNETVSIAKAIGIILMVLAHARIPLWGQHYINMFHMPLFFFFSGYCLKKESLGLTCSGYMKKKIHGVYWPYVKWSLLFLLLHNLFFELNIYNAEYGYLGKTSELYSVREYITHALNIVTRMAGHEQLLGGYWFMMSLFWASLIGFITVKLLNKTILGGGNNVDNQCIMLRVKPVCALLGNRY